MQSGKNFGIQIAPLSKWILDAYILSNLDRQSPIQEGFVQVLVSTLASASLVFYIAYFMCC